MNAPRPIIWQLIGGSNGSEGSDARRRIDPRLIAKGWVRWAEEDVVPLLNSYPGLVGFNGHNPGGTNPAEPMDFDQLVEARYTLFRNPGCSLDELRQAWRLIVAAADKAIFYTGTLLNDPDMDGRLAVPGAWLERATDSIRPLLDVEGLTIAIDQVAKTPVDHPAYSFIRLMESFGRKPMLEAYPPEDCPHLFDFDFWVVDDFYVNGIRDHPAQTWAAKREQLTGTVYRFARWNAATVAETRQRIRDIVAEGDVPIFRPTHLDWYMQEFDVK